MKSSHILLVVVLALVAGFGGAKLAGSAGGSQASKTETSYERVVRTQTLRCGYAIWEGVVMKNDKGEVYGPWIDITNDLGRAVGLKIEWVSEVGWGEIGAALKSNKIDAMCAGMWSSAMKAKEMALSAPVAYQGVGIFVRGDDHRFDADASLLNSASTKLAVIDSDNSDFVAQTDYPQAQRVGVGLMGTDADVLMNVATGKADATFVTPGTWRIFDRNSAGTVRPLHPGQYVRMFGLVYATGDGDHRLVQLINAGVSEIIASGLVDRILDKADKDYLDMFLRVIKNYR